MTLSDKAQAFMDQKPTVLGVCGERTYYEHPTHGDEVPMFYIEEGKLRKSEFWDMDSASEALWNSFA